MMIQPTKEELRLHKIIETGTKEEAEQAEKDLEKYLIEDEKKHPEKYTFNWDNVF